VHAITVIIAGAALIKNKIFMTVSFDQLPQDTRVWVYTANRLLTNEEVLFVETQMKQFTAEWSSHGNPLNAASCVFDQSIIVIAVENGWNDASGCSIDKSVGVLKHIEKELNVSFFDRMVLLYREHENDSILFIGLNKLKMGIKEGVYSSKGFFVNTQSSVLEHVKTSPWSPIENSWLVKPVVLAH
jgi:hypothetical protein